MFTILVKYFTGSLSPLSVSAPLHAAQGQTILDVLLEKNIAIRHDCGGMCACSTCHITVTKGKEYLEDKSVREQHYLNRLNDVDENSRLACQCLLLEKSGELEITIPIIK